MDTSDPIAQSGHSQLWKSFLGYGFAIAAILWVFHDIHIGRMWQSIQGMNWWWIVPAIFLDIAGYYCQGLRWRLLLFPVGILRPLKTTQAIYAGLFTNEIMPMRIGEFVRCYLVSRWLSVNFFTIIPSMAIERLFDGIVLAVAFAAGAVLIPLPKDLMEAGDILGIIVLILSAFFVFFIFRIGSKPSRLSQANRYLLRFSEFGRELAVGFRQIGRSTSSYIALAISALKFLLEMLAFWLVMLGYGIDLSLWKGGIVFVVLTLGTLLPNAPANVGTYQFFTVVGLQLFGIDKSVATGFSVVVFFVLTVPLWILGFYALMASGTNLATIKSDLNRLRAPGGKTT